MWITLGVHSFFWIQLIICLQYIVGCGQCNLGKVFPRKLLFCCTSNVIQLENKRQYIWFYYGTLWLTTTTTMIKWMTFNSNAIYIHLKAYYICDNIGSRYLNIKSLGKLPSNSLIPCTPLLFTIEYIYAVECEDWLHDSDGWR